MHLDLNIHGLYYKTTLNLIPGDMMMCFVLLHYYNRVKYEIISLFIYKLQSINFYILNFRIKHVLKIHTLAAGPTMSTNKRTTKWRQFKPTVATPAPDIYLNVLQPVKVVD